MYQTHPINLRFSLTNSVTTELATRRATLKNNSVTFSCFIGHANRQFDYKKPT